MLHGALVGVGTALVIGFGALGFYNYAHRRLTRPFLIAMSTGEFVAVGCILTSMAVR